MMASGRMTLMEAVEYIRNNEVHDAALAELQEVRAVLDSLRNDLNGCWCGNDICEPHSEACLRPPTSRAAAGGQRCSG